MSDYPNRSLVGVGAVVYMDDRMLLVRRVKPPQEGSWSLPGARQRIGEVGPGPEPSGGWKLSTVGLVSACEAEVAAPPLEIEVVLEVMTGGGVALRRWVDVLY